MAVCLATGIGGCLLYCVVLWCGVSETTERRMPPSFTAVDPVYPYLAFLPVPVRFPGAKLAAAHHSFHGFVAHCMTLEHKHELSARGFIECGFGGGLILWCGVAGLLCLYGSWVHHQVTRPLDRAVRLNARATPNPLMDTRSQLDPISSIKPLLSLNLNPASGKPSRPFLSKCQPHTRHCYRPVNGRPIRRASLPTPLSLSPSPRRSAHAF